MSELNKAEKYLLENLTNIAKFGSVDKNPRTKWRDGTDAHSIFINGVFESYDIANGETPITETRHTAWKTGVNELLAIYQSQTNSQEGFEKHNCHWWESWMNDEGNIGRAYSYGLESHRPNEMNREIVLVDIREFNSDSYEIENLPLVNDIKESIDGVVYESKYRDYGEYIITREFIQEEIGTKRVNNRPYVEVQFLKTGYITSVRKDSLDRGQHPKDNFCRTFMGVGYLGDFESVKNLDADEVKELKNIWMRMMRRCYDGTRKEYDGVYVHKRWHSFENFLLDVRYLPQYHLAKENKFKGYSLDKDYYGSNIYSKDSCVFLSTRDNATYRGTQKNPLKFISDYKTYTFISQSKAIEFFGISGGVMRNAIKKKKLTINEITYKIESLSDVEGKLYRLELSRNQIKELLYNLKHDPYSRRHILSFFNWSNIDKKMLVECAYETIYSYYTHGGEEYIDMTLIQRSSDYLTANYINKIQYVALGLMIAKHCGYKLGKFNHFVQNVHIYDRHIEQAEETIQRIHELKKRETQSHPILKLNVDDGTDFYSITADDFELIDYNAITPQLKFEVAI